MIKIALIFIILVVTILVFVVPMLCFLYKMWKQYDTN